MVAVKAEDGKILARSMLRLLWDKTESKPVLFLDRLYPNSCPKEREAAIRSAASQCARELGLELFIQGAAGSSTRKIIESLGSFCSYEYADGSDGVIPGGVFTIRNGQKVTEGK